LPFAPDELELACHDAVDGVIREWDSGYTFPVEVPAGIVVTKVKPQVVKAILLAIIRQITFIGRYQMHKESLLKIHPPARFLEIDEMVVNEIDVKSGANKRLTVFAGYDGLVNLPNVGSYRSGLEKLESR